MTLTYKIFHRILYRMKVTAIIKDNLISEVRKLAKGENLTESLTIALKEWVALKHIKELNSIVNEHHFEYDVSSDCFCEESYFFNFNKETFCFDEKTINFIEAAVKDYMNI